MTSKRKALQPAVPDPKRTRSMLPRKAKGSMKETVNEIAHQAVNDEDRRTDGAANEGHESMRAGFMTETDDQEELNATPLVNPPIRCETCYQEREPTEMVNTAELPASCRRCFGEDICHACLIHYFEHYFVSTEKHSIKIKIACAICWSGWEASEMEHFMGKLKLENLLQRISHRALEMEPTFRWCAADKCPSGQMHELEGEQLKICCVVCDSESCFKCRSLWHDGLSCEEYQDPDLRKHRSKRGEGVEVRKAMRKNETRRCPGCRSAIEKASGCNHVFCESTMYRHN